MNLNEAKKIYFGYCDFLPIRNHYRFQKSSFKTDPWNISSLFNKSLDSIVCGKTLEYMTHMEVNSCLEDWYQALLTGGIIQIEVPNTDYFAKLWLNSNWNENSLITENSKERIGRDGLNGTQETGNPMMDNYSKNYPDTYKSSYNQRYLEFLLLRVGFSKVVTTAPNDATLVAKAVKSMDKGERQIATDLEQIRPDHRARYYFAAEHVKDGDKILDFACGIGYGSKIIINKTKNVEITACDIDENALEYGNTFYSSKNICYQSNNANQPTLKESLYNLAVSFETIEHLENPQIFIEALYKSLKNNGKLICSVPNEEQMPFDRTRHPFHFRHYYEKELVQALSEAGFQKIQVFSQKNSGNCDIVKSGSGDFLILVAVKI